MDWGILEPIQYDGPDSDSSSISASCSAIGLLSFSAAILQREDRYNSLGIPSVDGQQLSEI